MYRSQFHVPRMDCPAEESLIRVALDGMDAVRALDFDLQARRVTIYHRGRLNEIAAAINATGLPATQQAASISSP